jgi:methionine sulfoxide reductase heme-binding subunit
VAKRPQSLDWLVPAVVTGSLLPHALLAYRALTGGLGADPIATALNQLGLLGLLLLLASLACTPLKIVSGWKWPLRVRKSLGLLGFFTVLGHFLVYLVFDRALAFGDLVEDVLRRPFIAVGFAAFVLLIPLALTSTKAALQRLGPIRWQRLHRLAYVIAALGVVHFIMRVKQDTTEPLLYGGVLGFLLLVRVFDFGARRLRQRERGRAAPTS